MTASLRDRLQVALGDAYVLGRELGGGAMSRVFAATETALDREVVIKVLPPDFVAGDPAERFRREILLAARLRHPHILPVYAAGEAAGYLYYTMPFVAGEPLRARLDREGPLPVTMATRIMREMASALAYAHRNGVVHRDVKPENIFLEEEGTDRALLADFGVARLLDTQSELTLTGAAIGTPLYMSPEQVDGGPIDGRTDVYSLGLVGWEMLAGRRPWAGETLYTIIYNQKYEVLPPINHLRADVPRRLQRAIERALAKDRDLRWPTADAFAAALTAPPALHHRVEPRLSGERDASDEAHTSPRPGVALVRRASGGRPFKSALAVLATVLLLGATVRAITGREVGRTKATSSAGDISDAARRAAASGGPTGSVGVSPAGGSPGGPAVPSPAASSTVARGTRPALQSAGGGSTGHPDTNQPPTDPAMGSQHAESRANPPTAALNSLPARSAERSSPNGPPNNRSPATGAAALLGQRASSELVRIETHTDSLARCNSPRPSDQQICLIALTSDDDAQTTRMFERLVAVIRKQAGTRPGAPDPPAARRLRAEQASWIGSRAAACERDASGRGNPRWAPYRAWCLSGVAAGRTDSLGAEVRRLAGND